MTSRQSMILWIVAIVFALTIGIFDEWLRVVLWRLMGWI